MAKLGDFDNKAIATKQAIEKIPLYINSMPGVDYDKPTYRIRISKRWHAITDTIRDMIKTINEDRLNPMVRAVAIKIKEIYEIPDLHTKENKLKYIQAVFDFIQKNCHYVEDPAEVEWLQRTLTFLLITHAGDCDDFTIAICSLLQSMNIDCFIRIIGDKSPNEFNHVYAVSVIDDDAIALDPIFRGDGGNNPKTNLGDEPPKILKLRDFKLTSLSKQLTGNYFSEIAVLNGVGNMKTNTNKRYFQKLSGDKQFFNNCIRCLGHRLYKFSKIYNQNNLGKYNPEDTDISKFTEAYTKSRDYFDAIPPTWVESMIENPYAMSIYAKDNLNSKDYEEIINNSADLNGYLLSGMLDGYYGRLSGGFFKNLWKGVQTFFKNPAKSIQQGISHVKKQVTDFTKNPAKYIQKSIKHNINLIKPIIPVKAITDAVALLNNPAIKTAASFIPGLSAIINSLDTTVKVLNIKGYSHLGLGRAVEMRERNITPQITTKPQVTPTSKHSTRPTSPKITVKDLPVIEALKDKIPHDRIDDIERSFTRDLAKKLEIEKLREISNSAKAKATERENHLNRMIKELERKFKNTKSEREKQQIEFKKQQLESEKQSVRNYIIKFLIWKELPVETRQKVIDTLKEQYDIFPPIISRPPQNAGGDIVNFYKQMLIKSKDNSMEMMRIYNMSMQDLSNKIEDIYEQMMEIRKDIDFLSKKKAKAILNGRLYGFGRAAPLPKMPKQNNNSHDKLMEEIETNIARLQEELNQSENKVDKMVEVYNDKFTSEIVDKIEELKKEKEDGTITDDEVNILLADLFEKLNLLREYNQLYQVEEIDDEDPVLKPKDEIERVRFELLKKQYRNSLEKLSQTFLNRDSFLNDRLKTATLLIRSARAMYYLLPPEARENIRTFEKQNIDLANPSAENLERLYKEYMKLLFQNRRFIENNNEEVQNLLSAIEGGYLEVDNYLNNARKDLDIIKKNLIYYKSLPSHKHEYDDLEHTYNKLLKERQRFISNQDKNLLDAIETGAHNLARKATFLLQKIFRTLKPEDTSELDLVDPYAEYYNNDEGSEELDYDDFDYHHENDEKEEENGIATIKLS